MNNFEILNELNVLYVDDHIQACKSIEKVLQYYFKNVFIAHNGKEALEIYHTKECHLLMVDYDMPLMNGYEFLSEIREKDDDISAMIISSYDDKIKLKNAIGLNLLEYIVKPYELDDLKDVLNKFVKNLEKKELLRYYVSDTLFYDRLKKTFIEASKEYTFTSYEIKLIEYLFKYKNQVIAYDNLLYTLEYNNQKSLVNSVYNINKKLGIKLIENVKDMGYRLKR